MSNQSIGTTYEDGRALAEQDKALRPPLPRRQPRYTHGFNGLPTEDRSPLVRGYLSLVDGKEWA